MKLLNLFYENSCCSLYEIDKKTKIYKIFPEIFHKSYYISTFSVYMSDGKFTATKPQNISEFDMKTKFKIYNFTDFSIVRSCKKYYESEKITNIISYATILGNQNPRLQIEYFKHTHANNQCNIGNYYLPNEILDYCFGYYNYIFQKNVISYLYISKEELFESQIISSEFGHKCLSLGNKIYLGNEFINSLEIIKEHLFNQQLLSIELLKYLHLNEDALFLLISKAFKNNMNMKMLKYLICKFSILDILSRILYKNIIEKVILLFKKIIISELQLLNIKLDFNDSNNLPYSYLLSINLHTKEGQIDFVLGPNFKITNHEYNLTDIRFDIELHNDDVCEIVKRFKKIIQMIDKVFEEINKVAISFKIYDNEISETNYFNHSFKVSYNNEQQPDRIENIDNKYSILFDDKKALTVSEIISILTTKIICRYKYNIKKLIE